MTFSVSPSLSQSGIFTAVGTTGAGTATAIVPSITCIICDPPITIPGNTQTNPVDPSSGPFTGTSALAGAIISIPMPLGGVMNGSLSGTALSLSYYYQLPVATGTVTIQISATLTRQ
jgi:hypothetical protein